MPLSVDIRIAPADNLIQRTVECILHQHAEDLPDLSRIVVLLPDHSACAEFRTQLLEQLRNLNIFGVIPPWCGTLRERVAHVGLPSLHLINEQSRRLLFIEALEQHRQLFREENTWQFTNALLKLFDELNLHQTSIDNDPEAWEDHLQLGYGLPSPHLNLNQEATLVHTLWHAWHQQLGAGRQCDASLAYVQRLALTVQDPGQDAARYYVATSSGYSKSELSYLQHLQQFHRCSVIEFDDSLCNDHPVWQLISNAFEVNTVPLLQRSKVPMQQVTLPFTVFSARDAETETRAVDLQIRQWLLAGHQRIGVVCEDRKLARRLRALLERANVPLHDLAGWSLATTSAATVIERWLECIETDFDYHAFLDILKSHFMPSEDRDQYLKNVYRLEHDIILNENIGHGLSRYRKQLAYRLDRLPHWPERSYDEITELLEHIQNIAAPLLKLFLSNSKHALGAYLETFISSLEALGIKRMLEQDAAGIVILQVLDDMQAGITCADPELRWQDFRNWLGMALEEQFFSPQAGTGAVQLMTLEQSALKHFDALVIAAADEQYLPGHSDTSPFFNQGVRKTLGLPTWETQREQRLHLFKRLLVSSDEVLITCKSHDNGEPIPQSPWIEALRVHSQLSMDINIENTVFSRWLALSPDASVCNNLELPHIPQQPAPVAPPQLIANKISAGAHQRLINCPYQYFAADILSLKPSEEISEELQKVDYGNRVHLILQAFHQKVERLPKPFPEPVTQHNRDAAIARLVEISERVFARDQQDNLLHRSWLHRWLDHVPAYIDWQIGQQLDWHVETAEQKYEREITDHLLIHGRLDRIDQGKNGNMIIDYKTGSTARQSDIENGEDVQLVSYAMLFNQANRVAYVSLDAQGSEVRTAAELEGKALSTMTQDCTDRLIEIYRLMRAKHPLTAWGDASTCAWCHFRGLCRKDVWEQSPGNNKS